MAPEDRVLLRQKAELHRQEPVSYTHLDVYKRQAVKNTIKRIWKQSVLKDFQHSQYVKLENGYSAHVYDMEVIRCV